MRKHNQVGWGKTHSSTSLCYTSQEFNEELRSKTKSGLPIGLGRSYGDSSINSQGIYLEVDSGKKIEINAKEMYATCSADVSIGELERAAIKSGFFHRRSQVLNMYQLVVQSPLTFMENRIIHQVHLGIL